MNFKSLKKTPSKSSAPTQERLPNPDKGVFKVAGKIITEELMKDAVMKVLIEELKAAVTATGNESETATNARNAVVKRYELLTSQNTATIGDLMASAKETRAKAETTEIEEFDITNIAPHQGELVVVSIVNPNTEAVTVNTKKGKITVPNMFKYVVSDGTTANNDTIHGIMVHNAKGISFDTRRKMKSGSVVKGILDWDPTKERYTLINVEIVQEAEQVGNPINMLNEWLQEHTMFDMEAGNVRKMSWNELTKMVQNVHPKDISAKLTELFPGGIILAEGRGSSRFYYTEKVSAENKA